MDLRELASSPFIPTFQKTKYRVNIEHEIMSVAKAGYSRVSVEYWVHDCPSNTLMFKVTKRNPTKRYEICSELTLKTPESRQCSKLTSQTLEQRQNDVIDVALASLLLTLNI